MTKTITKVGNSQGIIFDTALMDLARVKVGDKVKEIEGWDDESGKIISINYGNKTCKVEFQTKGVAVKYIREHPLEDMEYEK